IAKNEDGADRWPPVHAQPLDHLCRGRPAVDQITQEDQRGLVRWPLGQFPLNLREQGVEQVEAAVDVAHDISAMPGRAAWPRLAGLHGPEDTHVVCGATFPTC